MYVAMKAYMKLCWSKLVHMNRYVFQNLSCMDVCVHAFMYVSEHKIGSYMNHNGHVIQIRDASGFH